MTDNISAFPSLNQSGLASWRRMMRRAIRENHRVEKVGVPSDTLGKVISFRRLPDLPRIGKEDPVDG